MSPKFKQREAFQGFYIQRNSIVEMKSHSLRGGMCGRRVGRDSADEGSDGRDLEPRLQPVGREQHGVEEHISPQHVGLPQQQVHTQHHAAHREPQAQPQRRLGFCQVTLETCKETETKRSICSDNSSSCNLRIFLLKKGPSSDFAL